MLALFWYQTGFGIVEWMPNCNKNLSAVIEHLCLVQKTALKVILKQAYISYESALSLSTLEKLSVRREQLCLNFAKNCLKNDKVSGLFPEKNIKSGIEPRSRENYEVFHANTDRLDKSSIIYMQKLLNKI